MPRELPNYRDILERLDEAYPGKEVLTKTETAAWLGISTKTLKKRYNLPPGFNSKVQVAKAVASK